MTGCQEAHHDAAEQNGTPPPATTRKLAVIKFGGSSLADSARVAAAVEIIRESIKEGNWPIVVVSAMGKTTAALIAAANNAQSNGIVDLSALKEFHLRTATELGIKLENVTARLSDKGENPLNVVVEELFDQSLQTLGRISDDRTLNRRRLDGLMSCGERLSVRIVAGCLQAEGVPAKAWDAYDLGIQNNCSGSAIMEKVNVQISDAVPERVRTTLMKEYEVKGFHVPVVTGFIAMDDRAMVTTLGRGGSDLTAAIVGAAVSADVIEIWTDTDGVMTADPKLVPEAKSILQMSFDEAAELASFGAKVLHPRAVDPAAKTGVPIRVKNSFHRDHPGTSITKDQGSRPANQLACALSIKSPVTLLHIHQSRMLGQDGFLAEVFSSFKTHQVSVDVIATSEVSISISLDRDTDEDKLAALTAELRRKFGDVETLDNRAIVALIGDKSRAAEVLALSCGALRQLDVALEMVSLGASKLNTSLVIHNDHAVRALRSLHSLFFPVRL